MYVVIDWHVLSEGNPNTYKDDAVKFFDEMSCMKSAMSQMAGWNGVRSNLMRKP